MKPAHILLGIAAAALTTFAAISADSPSADIPLCYVEATELYDAVKQQLGPAAAAAVVSVDIRTNALKLDAAHPDATTIIGRSDQPMTLTFDDAAHGTIKVELLVTPDVELRRTPKFGPGAKL